MATQTVTKCLSGLLFIMLMCPKHTCSKPTFNSEQENYKAPLKRFVNYIPTPQIGWKLKNPINDGNEKPNDIVVLKPPSNKKKFANERGFDLTDEEMKKFKIWNKGVIPYYIDTLSFTDKVLRDRIRSFVNNVNAATSLTFVELPRPPQDWDKTRWVFFVNRVGQLGCGDHSVSTMTNEGVQRVVLGYDCMSTGGELAEAVLAIAGVPPQHNAPNRDKYIDIIEENIITEKKPFFEKLKNNEWLFHDIDYDFESAGHYHCHKYSRNGRATIEAKDSTAADILHERQRLSYFDIMKIKMLYNYIVKKSKKTKVPGCSKLFMLGKSQPDSFVDEVKPRKKPNKYLGIENEDDDGNTSGSDKNKNSVSEDETKEKTKQSDLDVSKSSDGGNTTDEENDKASSRDDEGDSDEQSKENPDILHGETDNEHSDKDDDKDEHSKEHHEKDHVEHDDEHSDGHHEQHHGKDDEGNNSVDDDDDEHSAKHSKEHHEKDHVEHDDEHSDGHHEQHHGKDDEGNNSVDDDDDEDHAEDKEKPNENQNSDSGSPGSDVEKTDKEASDSKSELKGFGSDPLYNLSDYDSGYEKTI